MVIAIIAVLVAILLPALAGARDSAKWTVCTSNQRQLVLSNLLYAQDYKDKLPHQAKELNPLGPSYPQPFWIPSSTINGMVQYGVIERQTENGRFAAEQLRCPAARPVSASEGWIEVYAYKTREDQTKIAQTDYCFAAGMTESGDPLRPQSTPAYTSRPQRNRPAVHDVANNQPDAVVLADATLAQSEHGLSNHSKGVSRAFYGQFRDFQARLRGVNRSHIDGSVVRVPPSKMGFNGGQMARTNQGARAYINTWLSFEEWHFW